MMPPANAGSAPGSQLGGMDPVEDPDRLFDFFIAPSAYRSPSETSGPSMQTPLATPIIKDESLPSDQGYPAPSHEYGAYKQQTGIVPGALATTLAMNQSNQHMLGFLDYNSGGIDFAETDDFFDFSAPPSQSLMPSPESLHMMSPEASLFSHPTVDPNFIGGQEGGVMPPPLSSHVGRLRPGMHQQAAMAKAQQQKVLQQQRMNARKQAQQLPQQQAAAALAPNAQLIQANKMMVEQKINKVLGAVQCEEPKMEGVANHPVLNQPPKPKKSFEEMDADERLLASEEGKAMNRLEKRQVRNKVSARAFRERRKGKRHHSTPFPTFRLNSAFVIQSDNWLTHYSLHRRAREGSHRLQQREQPAARQEHRAGRGEQAPDRPEPHAALVARLLADAQRPQRRAPAAVCPATGPAAASTTAAAAVWLRCCSPASCGAVHAGRAG